MKYDPTEYRLLLSEEQKRALSEQITYCEAIREVQRVQIQKTVDYNKTVSDPRHRQKPPRVFGSPLSSLSAWTGGNSLGLWAATNMGMMGYPLNDVISPKWDHRFTYRGPHKGIQQNDVGALYLPQLNHLGLLKVEGVSSPVASGSRLMAVTFRVVPSTDAWFVSFNVSAKPLKITRRI